MYVKNQMGLTRFELVTPSLSEKCSNQLSYSPDRYTREEKEGTEASVPRNFFFAGLPTYLPGRRPFLFCAPRL